MVDTCKVKEHNGRQYRCYFELTLNTIGGKWKPVILYHLAQEGVLRFGELRKNIPDITQRMLTRQLRELESDGLVYRHVYREVPPRVEYSLLEPGVRLIPILLQMRDWGLEFEKKILGRMEDGDGYELCQAPTIDRKYREQLQSL